MAARDLVFAAGDRVRTWSQYVAGPDGDWLDLARVHDLTFRPAVWKSDRSIRLIWTGAEAVPTEFAANRGPGHVSVIGTWHDESIEVEAKSSELPAQEPFADCTDPPCPPPPRGWRPAALVYDLDYGDLESSGAMINRVIFRSSADQEVLVVAATDVGAVTRQLSPQLPDQLCVVPSRFTSAQLDEVRDVLLAHWREWRLESFSTGADVQAQPFVTAQLFRVTPEIADRADSLPAGLFRLRPALSPA